MSDYQTNLRGQFPTLTKIHGDSTYASLAKLTKECKANGKSVPTTLGGGLQGHLGLVTSAVAYEQSAPGTPFTCPNLPVLANLAEATQFQIGEGRHTFSEETKTYNLCNQVERSIIQLINSSIDTDCLADLYDEETGLLTGTIPEILQNLFNTYGNITPQALAAAKMKVEATVYDHSKPILQMFMKINEYNLMADHAHSAETQRQMINLGLIIITKSNIFASDIRKWHSRPNAKKTWQHFKTHFKEAQQAIRQSQPTITTDSLGYHGQASAATIVDEVISKLSSQQSNTSKEAAKQQMQQAVDHMANSTQHSETMATQMQALATTISNLQSQVNQKQPLGQGRGGGRGGGRGHGGQKGQSSSRGNNNRGNNSSPPAYCKAVVLKTAIG
jgi:hypothetical protein